MIPIRAFFPRASLATERKHIGPAIVPRHIQIELAPRDLVQIQVRNDQAFAFRRPSEDLSSRRNHQTPKPPPHDPRKGPLSSGPSTSLAAGEPALPKAALVVRLPIAPSQGNRYHVPLLAVPILRKST